MGQVRHGCATTTHAVRAAIQRSQASLAALSRELGINPKTVAKWRKRATVEDPLGLQVICMPLDEQGVLNAGLAIEQRAGFTARPQAWW